jgi:hypothetical protein
MAGFQLHHLGLVMEPAPRNPLEAEGVLNGETSGQPVRANP